MLFPAEICFQALFSLFTFSCVEEEEVAEAWNECDSESF